MLFTLPDRLVWRPLGKGHFYLELDPQGFVVGSVIEEKPHRWRTTVAQHREGSRQLHAPATSKRQAKYFVGRWTAAHLAAIQAELRGRAPCTWGMKFGPPHPLPPGVEPYTGPARPKRRSRRNPSSL